MIHLPLSTISDLQADGFLPTFGPCFINMYGAPREFSEISSTLDGLNHGKVNRYVLISLTNLNNFIKRVKVQLIEVEFY